MIVKWAQMGATERADVPKTGFLVFGKKVLAFLGGATAVGCPQNGVSCFRKKGFGVFGGCNRAKCGRRMSPKRGFLFPEKSFSGFRGVQQKRNAAVGCPQNGVSCFRKKGFGVFGGCNKTLIQDIIFACIRNLHSNRRPRRAFKRAVDEGSTRACDGCTFWLRAESGCC